MKSKTVARISVAYALSILGCQGGSSTPAAPKVPKELSPQMRHEAMTAPRISDEMVRSFFKAAKEQNSKTPGTSLIFGRDSNGKQKAQLDSDGLALLKAIQQDCDIKPGYEQSETIGDKNLSIKTETIGGTRCPIQFSSNWRITTILTGKSANGLPTEGNYTMELSSQLDSKNAKAAEMMTYQFSAKLSGVVVVLNTDTGEFHGFGSGPVSGYLNIRGLGHIPYTGTFEALVKNKKTEMQCLFTLETPQGPMAIYFKSMDQSSKNSEFIVNGQAMSVEEFSALTGATFDF